MKLITTFKKLPKSLKLSMPKQCLYTSHDDRNNQSSRNNPISPINHYSQNTDDYNSTYHVDSIPLKITNIKYNSKPIPKKTKSKHTFTSDIKPIALNENDQGSNMIIDNGNDDNNSSKNLFRKIGKSSFKPSKTANFSSLIKHQNKKSKISSISHFQLPNNVQSLIKNEQENEHIIDAIFDDGSPKSIQEIPTLKPQKKKTFSSNHLTLKSKMMQNMKALTSKRVNHQIFIPISTLLELTNKPSSGKLYIKDFQGKIYSPKISKNNFIFSNIHHSFFIEQNIFGLENFFLFGVFECEGNEGYQISSIAKMNFIYFFSSEFIYNTIKKPTEEEIYLKLIENDYKLLKVSFDKISNDISLSRYNSKKSGVSLSLAIVVGNKLICASVGLIKSMAILYKNENDKENLNGYEFSSYHCFNNPHEKRRVEEFSKGTAVYDKEKNIYQYLVNNECIHDMKLTRALGLKHYRPYGLINVPEINEVIINQDCRCLFIANKGFYDVLGITFILKMLCLGMSQKETISFTGNKILSTYKKRLNTIQDSTIASIDPDCVFLIVYF